MVVNVFDNSPCNRQAIICGRAATDLVKNQQTTRRGMMQNIRRLHHLHHKGGLPGMDFILRANAGEDAIHQTDLCRSGWDE